MDYDKINKWLKDPQRDYKKGIELFSRAGGDKKYIQFFHKGESKQSLDMLTNQLARILRIAGQQKKYEKPAKQAVPPPKPIIRRPSQAGRLTEDVTTPIVRTKQTTNKLLSFEWESLNSREKEYFIQKEIFLQKKEDFKKAKEQRQLVSKLHDQLKQSKDDKTRKEIAVKLVSANSVDRKLWNRVDDFSLQKKETVKPPLEKRTPEGNNSLSMQEALKLTKRLNNLRTYISKNNKALSEITDEKKRDKKQKQIIEQEKEIKEIESKLNG